MIRNNIQMGDADGGVCEDTGLADYRGYSRYEYERMRRRRRRRRRQARMRLMRIALFVVSVALLAFVAYWSARAIRGSDRAQETAALSQSYIAPIPADDAVTVEVEAAEPEERDPLPAVDLSSWELRLVRFDHPLEQDFAPELVEIEGGEMYDVRAAAHLQRLIKDARADGYGVFVCSCYRSYDIQSIIYWNHVNDYMAEGMTQEEAEAKTRLAVNYPGASEHQLGLAADILEYSGQDMEPYIGGSGLMLWMEEHCADYGFVIRYPDGKTDITGVEYEPWHLRYVGTSARYIMEHGLCLEEFLALYEDGAQ